jgi:hypothetical protein
MVMGLGGGRVVIYRQPIARPDDFGAEKTGRRIKTPLASIRAPL